VPPAQGNAGGFADETHGGNARRHGWHGCGYNDQPLNQQQRRDEYGRIERFVNQPAELERKRKQEKESAERVSLILKALPDAFLYEYDGTETGRAGVGKSGDPLLRLKFRPNPRYDPPSRVEQVLTGMQGVVLLDPQKQRIARIDGTLFKDVGFGWGISAISIAEAIFKSTRPTSTTTTGPSLAWTWLSRKDPSAQEYRYQVNRDLW